MSDSEIPPEYTRPPPPPPPAPPPPAAPPAAPAGPRRITRRASTDEPIAIVGMSARFPGGVRSAEDLWD
uniref:beta-ketoacyl synthase N-terminal-like domain-containing protein n=1 Tax=Nocardia neocaledoniensis TaxID=236511 RepID=UPI002454CC52